MKRRILLYIEILIITSIMTYQALPISHALDSYCTMCHGYSDTALWFLKDGRVFSYLFYNLFDFIKLSFDYLGIVSVIFGNVILSYAILKLYLELIKYLNAQGKLLRIVLLLLIILLFYNQLYVSILLLDEAFIIDLGIMLATLASIRLMKGNLKNCLLSLFLLILSVMCYQGIVNYFIVIVILLMTIKSKDNLIKKENFKTIGLAIVFYGIAFFCDFIVIKLAGEILKNSTSKLGTFSIINNLEIIFTQLLPTSLLNLFGFINAKYYYLIIVVLVIVSGILIIKNNNKINKIISFLLILASVILVSFIPNLFMNSNGNYIDARMALTLGIIPMVIIIYIIFNFKITKKFGYFLGIITVCIFLVTCYRIRQNLRIDLRRYDTDIEYINKIKEKIFEYQEENHIKINTIYYTYDKSYDYYYNFGYSNGANIRLFAVDWALECAIKPYIDDIIIVSKMDDETKVVLFKNNEYELYDDEQLVFDKNVLYLLIY